MEVTLEQIISALARARAEAEIMAERFPDYQAPFLRFAAETSRAQRELLKKIGDHAVS